MWLAISRRRPRSASLLAAGTVLSVALSGCGDNDQRGSPTATPDLVFTIVTPTAGTARPRGTETGESQERYVVQEGDTLSSIATRFGVSESALQRANGLSDPNAIFVGQELIIPAA